MVTHRWLHVVVINCWKRQQFTVSHSQEIRDSKYNEVNNLDHTSPKPCVPSVPFLLPH